MCLRCCCTRIVWERSQIFYPRSRHASVKPVVWPLIRLPLFQTHSSSSEVFSTIARPVDIRPCFLRELGNSLLQAKRYPPSTLPRVIHANRTRLRLSTIVLDTHICSVGLGLCFLLLMGIEMRGSNGDAGNSSEAQWHGASPKKEDADRRVIASEVQVRRLSDLRSALSKHSAVASCIVVVTRWSSRSQLL